MSKPIKKVLIMAGGTGGHVFPGIALAQAFAEQEITTHWLGTVGGLEENWVKNAGLPFNSIAIKGLRGNGLKGWLFAPFKVLQAFLAARKVIKQLQPDLVVGMGGFVCGPGGLAAKSLGLPLFLHEQNAIPGLTNKLLAPLSRKVFCGFPVRNWAGKCEVVGNPVRAEIEAVPVISAEQKNHILVVGGSRGAQALNEVVPEALAILAKDFPAENLPSVLHQTGLASVDSTKQNYQTALKNSPQPDLVVAVEPFIEDMAQAYQQATLVIARAGALTVAELSCAGRPAIFIPFPWAVDDHQTANAQTLVEQGNAQLIQQKDLTAEKLSQMIAEGLDRNLAIEQSNALKQKSYQQSAASMVQKIISLIN